MNKEVNEKKKRYAIVITFLVLMVCITGGTYAYFALTASNNSVTGSVGGASLNLEVTKVYPTSEHNNKNMIPQLESTLDEAISLEHKCIDGNGNVICQVYSATVTNVGSTTSVLNGMISFTGIENMPNLKWMRINDSNTLGTYASSIASTEKALFEEERSFGANTSNTYYFVFWIDETGEVQTDNGEFRANIEFDSSDGGLTSTVKPPFDTICEYQNNGVPQKTAGAKYNCKVDPNKPEYTFYFLHSNEDGTCDLIMNANINESGEAVIPGVTSDTGLVAWYADEGNNIHGPITSIEYLHNATKDWTNVDPLNYEYNDRKVQGIDDSNPISNITGEIVGYTSFVSKNGVATITKGDNERTQVTIGSETEPLRTRMPIYSSDDNITEVTDVLNAPYLYDNLDDLLMYEPNGYWTLSSFADSSFGAWQVQFNGSVNFYSIDFTSGVRPVITLEM